MRSKCWIIFIWTDPKIYKRLRPIPIKPSVFQSGGELKSMRIWKGTGCSLNNLEEKTEILLDAFTNCYNFAKRHEFTNQSISGMIYQNTRLSFRDLNNIWLTYSKSCWQYWIKFMNMLVRQHLRILKNHFTFHASWFYFTPYSDLLFLSKSLPQTKQNSLINIWMKIIFGNMILSIYHIKWFILYHG